MKSIISASDKEICLLDESNPYQAATPPIIQSALFTFKCFEDYRNHRLKKHKQPYYYYTRGNNPTTNILEDKLARLERGEACRVFSSGMGAVSAALISHLKAGDHILFVNTIYVPTMGYAAFLERFNISYTYIKHTDILSIKDKLQPNTRMIYVESPGSVDLQVVDLHAVAKLGKELNILTIIDNTYSTPLFQKPLELGIDISIHSCSKYIGGHADVMAGAVITSHKLMYNIEEYGFKLHGAVPSPHDAYLLLRGLRTMPARLEAIQEPTAKVVDFLANHRRVIKVNHPLAYNEADKKIFMAQANGYTSLLSIELDVGNYADLAEFVNKLKHFHIGVSWGGYENLVLTPNIAGEFNEIKALGDKPNLVRFALGLFDAESIIADISQALDCDK